MSEADKKRILERLADMRGEILAKIRPREQECKTEKPPEQPYVFLRQRVEKPGEVILAIPVYVEWLRLAASAVFAAICFWR